MGVFDLWSDVFYKYVFVLMEYSVFHKNVFSVIYENVSTYKNTSTYLYLQTHLNMLLYVSNVLIRKYAHICTSVVTLHFTYFGLFSNHML